MYLFTATVALAICAQKDSLLFLNMAFVYLGNFSNVKYDFDYSHVKYCLGCLFCDNWISIFSLHIKIIINSTYTL